MAEYYVPQPDLGYVTDATCIDVTDGDTCVVQISKVVKIRLEDCWAPEKDQKGGSESTANLIKLIEGKQVRVRLGGNSHVWRTRSFDREVGRVWVDGLDVTEQQIQSGHAFRTKEEQEGAQ